MYLFLNNPYIKIKTFDMFHKNINLLNDIRFDNCH